MFIFRAKRQHERWIISARHFLNFRNRITNPNQRVSVNRLKLWLTERIGNIGELRPYFRLWDDAKLHNDEGVLQIIVCEHDADSLDVPRIPKQLGGNSKKGKKKRDARRARQKKNELKIDKETGEVL